MASKHFQRAVMGNFLKSLLWSPEAAVRKIINQTLSCLGNYQFRLTLTALQSFHLLFFGTYFK